jgi:hypothetical protein
MVVEVHLRKRTCLRGRNFLDPRWKILMLLSESIFKDHRINNLPAEDTPPPGKVFARAIKLFKDHDPATPMTLHVDSLLLRIRKNPPTTYCPAPPRTGHLMLNSLIFATWRGEVNRVNPVFRGMKYCILREGNYGGLIMKKPG